MTVRLAFAVAAHLEPEILIVDEVLAVGDAEFQKKCLDKMNDVAGEGRTILFVSHNMAAIHSLCSRAILLQTGESVFDGQVDDTINRYISSVQSMVSEQSLSLRTDRTGGERFRFDAVEFLDAETMAPTSTLLSGQSILIRLNFTCTEEAGLQAVSISIGFYGLTSGFLFACRSDAVGKSYDIDAGKGEFVCRIPRWPLNHGRFRYNLIARSRGEIVDWVREAGFIDSELGDFFGTGRLPASTHQGVFVEYDYAQQMSFIAEEQT
jgi:lipopolysaccharide transport system ATP-binding protein